MRALCKEDQELVLDYVKEKIDSMDVKFKEEFYIHNEIKVKEESSTPLKRPLEESYAPSERNFSHNGFVVSERRSCLRSDSLNSVLFINSALCAKKLEKK